MLFVVSSWYVLNSLKSLQYSYFMKMFESETLPELETKQLKANTKKLMFFFPFLFGRVQM